MRVARSGFHSLIGRCSAATLLAAIYCGTACASGGEVAEARIDEERWERVPVVAPGADTGAAAAPAAAAEELRFDSGAAVLTPSTRASLDRLAARMRGDNAGCRVELRAVPGAAPDRLAQKRAAAVRRYLSREQGIGDHRISNPSGAAITLAEGAGGRPRCVLVASFG